MKKINVLILTILIAYVGHSQNSKDTTCLPNEQLKTALKKIEQGKVDAVELQQVKGQNQLLVERVDSKDQIIRTLENRLNTQTLRIQNYEVMDQNYRAQVILINDQLNQTKKALKKQTRKTIFIGIFAMLVTGGLIFSL